MGCLKCDQQVSGDTIPFGGASLVAQRLKRLLAMRMTWVRSLGREDPLEKEMATHSNIGVEDGEWDRFRDI